MKALFITPPSHEPYLIVAAWNSWNEEASHRTFDVWGDPDDEGILQAVREVAPDVIFYVGANLGEGLPSHETFRRLRTYAPAIHLCWDATDDPWHAALQSYKEGKCFDLQVAMDGGTDSPVDMATLTPVDPRPYKHSVTHRGIRCAFSGQNVARAAVGVQHPRWDILARLVGQKWVEFCPRTERSYDDYANYIKSCKILLNISHTGSGLAHHVKVRVVEAGMAGCALLEMDEAPTRNWIPEECLFIYRDVGDAIRIIKSVSTAHIADKASALNAYVMKHYSPQTIYERILVRI